jgi:hypothetical protein
MVAQLPPIYEIDTGTIDFDQQALPKIYRLLYDAAGVHSHMGAGMLNRRRSLFDWNLFK